MNNNERVYSSTPVVHVYGPSRHGDNVVIAANREGLESLYHSLKRILNYDAITTEDKLFHSDGAAYTLLVVLDEKTDALIPPYQDAVTELCERIPGMISKDKLVKLRARTPHSR